MTDRNLRWLGLALLESAGAGCLTSAINPANAYADASTLIMGGTGNPDPDNTYLPAQLQPPLPINVEAPSRWQ
jgi:hypothetical protein